MVRIKILRFLRFCETGQLSYLATNSKEKNGPEGNSYIIRINVPVSASWMKPWG
jgi:hypothetical protein